MASSGGQWARRATEDRPNMEQLIYFAGLLCILIALRK